MGTVDDTWLDKIPWPLSMFAVLGILAVIVIIFDLVIESLG